MELSEKDAVVSYAKAWNSLNPSDFIKLLDEDARYASQYVFDEIIGKRAIADYLEGKMLTVKNSDSPVFAELGQTRTGDCVVLSQKHKTKAEENRQAVVIFEVNNNKIRRFDLCIAQLYPAKRSGIYPTIDE